MRVRGSAAVISAFLVVFMPLAAAQQQLDVGAGAVGPGSPLYGLEVAMDNAAVDIGLAKASNVAQERAAEARKAAENGNYRAAQKAADNMASVAKKAKSNETEGLQKAESVLEEVIANAPSEAVQGLNTALDNVRNERRRTTGQQPSTPQQREDRQPGQQPGQSPEGTDSQQDRSTDDGEQSAPAVEKVSATPDRTLEASNFEFSSESVSVDAGTVVRFVNTEGSHTVTVDTAGIDETISGSESVTLRFNEAGTFEVYCRFHGSPGTGMHTDVSVE